jgi:hypothetical protein
VDIAERIEANRPQPGKRGPYKKRATMGRPTINAQKILVYYNGVRCGHVPRGRIVFDAPRLRVDHPDAAGFINYQAAIAVLHRDADGALSLESTEPLIHGYRPLTLKEW